jgi:predicted transposase/invertase (TIGR01784 family)
MPRRLSPKNDFVFISLFGREEHQDLLISLLNAILDLRGEAQLREIEILKNLQLSQERLEEKTGTLDIRARTVAGTEINIEIQLLNQFNMEKRTLFYWSKIFTEQLKPGQNFRELKKTIAINILDFDFLALERYHGIFHL